MSNHISQSINSAGPFLIPDAETATLQQLAGRPGLSSATLRRMNQKHRICRQTKRNAPLLFSVPAVEMLRHGDLEALDLLKAGDRASPRVRAYLDMLGFSG